MVHSEGGVVGSAEERNSVNRVEGNQKGVGKCTVAETGGGSHPQHGVVRWLQEIEPARAMVLVEALNHYQAQDWQGGDRGTNSPTFLSSHLPPLTEDFR